MVDFYVMMIKQYGFKLEDVLEPWRKAVEEALAKKK